MMKRDISFWIDKDVSFDSIIKLITKSKAPFLIDTRLCDVYDGKKHGDSKINYTFSFMFQSPDGTLTDDNVNASFKEIVKLIETKLPIIFA